MDHDNDDPTSGDAVERLVLGVRRRTPVVERRELVAYDGAARSSAPDSVPISPKAVPVVPSVTMQVDASTAVAQYEYRTITYRSTKEMDAGVNVMARQGWIMTGNTYKPGRTHRAGSATKGALIGSFFGLGIGAAIGGAAGALNNRTIGDTYTVTFRRERR